MIDTEKLTTEQLEAELKRRQEAEKKAKAERRKHYEARRDQMVTEMVARAIGINHLMSQFKREAIELLDSFKTEAIAYGDIRSNSKGGFSIRSADGKKKVVYERNTKIEYDERATVAEELLRDFLGDMVKKRDKPAYELVTGLLERGKDGQFNPAAVASLVKMEDKYSDDRWVKSIQLFKEAHATVLIGMNITFYQKDEMNRDVAIPLTFASIPVETETDKTEA